MGFNSGFKGLITSVMQVLQFASSHVGEGRKHSSVMPEIQLTFRQCGLNFKYDITYRRMRKGKTGLLNCLYFESS